MTNNTAKEKAWNGNFQLTDSIFTDEIRLKNDVPNHRGDVEFINCFMAHKEEQLRVSYVSCHFEVTNISWLNSKPWWCQQDLTRAFTCKSLVMKKTGYSIFSIEFYEFNWCEISVRDLWTTELESQDRKIVNQTRWKVNKIQSQKTLLKHLV